MDELSGIVDSIVFKSEDTGYTVAKINTDKNIYTIVGEMVNIKEMQNLKLIGSWIMHKQFGRQFKVEKYEEILPSSIDGIEKYLSSGVIYGIGPVTAKKIVNKFGEKTLEILDKDINRLSEIEGIGKKKLKIIIEAYEEQRDLKDIMMFFQNHGLTVKQCMKIHKKFGILAIDIVKENPYCLCEEISGIGFKTADNIAKSLGFQENSTFRIQSGLKYIINKFCANGNTYMPKELLVKEAIGF